MPRGTRLGRFEDVVVHRSNILPAHHRSTVRHLPVSTTARVLFELTAVVRLGRVARAMDTAIARRQVDYLDLVRMLGDVSRKGRRRTRWFRLLLGERGPLYVPPESELERRFLALVTTPELGDWDRQVDLGGCERWVGRVDFFQRDARLVVEVDGRAAHSSLLDRRADTRRDRDLVAGGFTVLRFGWAEVVGDAERVRADDPLRARRQRHLIAFVGPGDPITVPKWDGRCGGVVTPPA